MRHSAAFICAIALICGGCGAKTKYESEPHHVGVSTNLPPPAAAGSQESSGDHQALRAESGSGEGGPGIETSDERRQSQKKADRIETGAGVARQYQTPGSEPSSPRDGAVLQLRVEGALQREKYGKLPITQAEFSHLSITADDKGKVSVLGTVGTLEEKRGIVRLIKKVPGVQSVDESGLFAGEK